MRMSNHIFQTPRSPERRSVTDKEDEMVATSNNEASKTDHNPYVSPNLDIILGRKGLTTARYVMDIASHDFFQAYIELKGISEAEMMRRAVNALNEEEIP